MKIHFFYKANKLDSSQEWNTNSTEAAMNASISYHGANTAQINNSSFYQNYQEYNQFNDNVNEYNSTNSINYYNTNLMSHQPSPYYNNYTPNFVEPSPVGQGLVRWPQTPVMPPDRMLPMFQLNRYCFEQLIII